MSLFLIFAHQGNEVGYARSVYRFATGGFWK